ncbi:hypothetical protein JM79_2127 [Gramella sp. Hel_I_59]|uniref:hypothetical protein n=1 Tax=Gramella sp. Hel_I_59 TaxID=1249978 RepID=UPI00114F79C4|nr:hypothetical protein [Gramella sp. Hel_I_59]TQI71200.1 hypothetical protein JM79_2127 [Gramella sp. Hel_I_59]
MRETLLNKDTFENHFRDYLDEMKIPYKEIYQNEIELPFHIPVQDGYNTFQPFEDLNFSSMLYFSSRKKVYSVRVYDGVEDVDTKVTVVNLCLFSEKFDFTEIESEDNPKKTFVPELQFYFSKSLEHLNSIITAYAIHFQDKDVYNLTRFDLNEIQSFEHIRTRDWKVKNWILSNPNNININKETLSKRQLGNLVRFHDYLVTNDYIFYIPEKYILNAHFKLKSGLFSESIIFSQIAIEVKIKKLYRYFLEKGQIAIGEIDDLIEKTAFKTLIKTEIPTRLGGNWDLTLEYSEVTNWYNRTYKIRNRIVHSGFEPGE